MNDAPQAAPMLTPDSPHSDHKDYTLPGDVVIRFQKGALALGRNGVTTEELLNVLIDHIGSFQFGKFACEENAALLDNLEAGRYWVQLRAERRAAQGVKGRDAIHFTPEEPTEGIMRFFECAHLPPRLATVSRPFGILANLLVANLNRSAERTVALRKLLESKDAAVRASIPEGPSLMGRQAEPAPAALGAAPKVEGGPC